MKRFTYVAILAVVTMLLVVSWAPSPVSGASAVASIAAFNANAQSRFTSYLNFFRKSYHANEFHGRLNIFRSNVERMLRHNAQRKIRYVMDVNAFADESYEEFARKRLMDAQFSEDGLRQEAMDDDGEGLEQQMVRDYLEDEEVAKLPKSFDARDIYEVPILNQGSCGSCWTFSVAFGVEGALGIHGRSNPTKMSEQYLLDCSECGSCSGGYVQDTLDFVMANGMYSDAQYGPYTGRKGTCKKDVLDREKPTQLVYQKSTASYKTTQVEQFLMKWLMEGGVMVSLDAQANYVSYRSGIYDGEDSPSSCRDGATNHAVNLVGWGEEKVVDEDTGVAETVKYWIMRNSWGTSWGENGYARYLRGVNLCAVEYSIRHLSMTQPPPPPPPPVYVPPPEYSRYFPPPPGAQPPPVETPVAAPKAGFFRRLFGKKK